MPGGGVPHPSSADRGRPSDSTLLSRSATPVRSAPPVGRVLKQVWARATGAGGARTGYASSSQSVTSQD